MSLPTNAGEYVNDVSPLSVIDISPILFISQASVEHMWAIKAMKYAETHFKVRPHVYFALFNAVDFFLASSE